MKNYLTHHGILGQKWGVRRTPAQLGHKVSAKKPDKAKAETKKDTAEETSKKKSIKEMTDDEIRAKINRLELERKYSDLVRSSENNNKAKKLVMNVLEKSGTNIATQATTYAMGALVNKAVGKEIVNPKKGQKDK